MPKRFSGQPAGNLRAAFEQDKQIALLDHRRGIERIAELMSHMKPATLYDWIDELRMPVSALPAWEHATGGGRVIRYLASQGGRMLIDVPHGRPLQASDVQGVQRTTHDAIDALLGFTEGKTSAEATMDALLKAMTALAWHRENVRKHDQPELDLQ